MDFEWDEAESEENRRSRDLPFDVAVVLFEADVVQQADNRRHYGEVRMQAVGVVSDLFLTCVFTDRGLIRRIISLRRANRKERDAYRSAFPG